MINEILGTGSAAAIPARDLIKTLNIDTRTFYATVERERNAGHPICANKNTAYGPTGYYLAGTKQEADSYARMVDFTAQGMKRTARAIRKAGATLPETKL